MIRLERLPGVDVGPSIQMSVKYEWRRSSIRRQKDKCLSFHNLRGCSIAQLTLVDRHDAVGFERQYAYRYTTFAHAPETTGVYGISFGLSSPATAYGSVNSPYDAL